MKKIPKKLLDAHIEAARAYWNGYRDSDIEQRKRHEVKMETSIALEKAIGVDWCSIQNFIDGILTIKGFAPDAENHEIYCALRCIGWMPVDE